MTQIFATNKDNDMYIDNNGNIAVLSGIDAVMQACEHAAKAQLNEMIFSTESGVPNFQTIWRNGNANISQYESYLRSAILAVDGVTNIKSLDIRIDKNSLLYTAVINTIYGEGIANGL